MFTLLIPKGHQHFLLRTVFGDLLPPIHMVGLVVIVR
jgi:hypothetical protein